MLSVSKIMTVERVNEKVISSEKSLVGESVDLNGPEKAVMDFQKDPAKNTEQFYKLIEYDGGIPFHLMFGKDPGEDYYVQGGNGIENLTGIKASELTGKSFRNLVEEIVSLSDNTPSDYYEIRRRMLSGDIPAYRIEIRLTTVAGKKKWVREASMAVKDEAGAITGMIGILHDISDVKRVMSYLKEAGDYEYENERLKTAFLQNISHEVRTPLNAIVGFSTLLCEPEEGYHRKKEFARMLNNSTDHFLEVMDNIMEIARIEAGSSAVKLNDVDLSVVVNRVLRTFSQRAEERGLSLICNIPETDNLTIMTDSYKLLQAINNLVENALKFTLSGKVEFGFINNDSSVEFFVTDTGIGIADEHKDLIFNKFYQADSGSTRRFPGIGLGLSIAKAYVEMLGGSIECVSKTGEGSTFRFNLPR